MDRSAPKGGYNAHGQKREYRRQVWGSIRASLGDARMRDAAIALLPSCEGDEIRVAIRSGVREQNVHAIDRNAALLASAPWRKTWPLVKVYGNEIVRAAERIAASGVRLSAANLDLCGCASRTLRGYLSRFTQTGVLAEYATLAITILRGRELPRETQSLTRWGEVASRLGVDAHMADSLVGERDLTQRDIGRMCVVTSALCLNAGRAWKPIRLGIYRTHKSTMLWWVVETIDTNGPLCVSWGERLNDDAAFEQYRAALQAHVDWVSGVAAPRLDVAIRENDVPAIRWIAAQVKASGSEIGRLAKERRVWVGPCPWTGFVGIPGLIATREARDRGEEDEAVVADILGMGRGFDEER